MNCERCGRRILDKPSASILDRTVICTVCALLENALYQGASHSELAEFEALLNEEYKHRICASVEKKRA